MVTDMKTPGVYIVEKNAFTNSVVEVETAIPAFIGYTEKGFDANNIKPKKISSMLEFQKEFGGASLVQFEIKCEALSASAMKAELENVGAVNKHVITFIENGIKYTIEFYYKYALYHSMLLYFANGGGPCYIASVGKYDNSNDIIVQHYTTVIDSLKNEKEPTLLVIPDAANSKVNCQAIQNKMASHCEEVKNRIAIFDIIADRLNQSRDINTARGNLKSTSYGTAYYPWLNTSVVSDGDVTESSILFTDTVVTFIDRLLGAKKIDNDIAEYVKKNVKTEGGGKFLKAEAHHCLLQNTTFYKHIISIIKEQLNLLPPSAAIAGVYATVDKTRGVWKAPANVSLNSVIKPSLNFSDAEQAELNVPAEGKAVNLIRSFTGEGVKVWGARTLAGNSDDWRYINVRRTMIFLEQSIKNAARAYVFEPNDANTWLNLKCMIDNFLRSVWKRGGLPGATPEEAYMVRVGLGETMSSQDILDGIMRIAVLVAISRPAEFIEVTFQQQMQKS